MRIHYFQHMPFEGPGCIQDWCLQRGYSLTSTRFFERSNVPSVDQYDWLIVMGGEMGVYDDDQYPWLVEEKRAIREAIDHGKVVVGICLGAQLIASVLGARVQLSSKKEIGWFDVDLTREGKKHPLFDGFSGRMKVFQWHGDAFDIPDGAIHMASSEASPNQAFIFGENVLGLQFHFEITRPGLVKMLEDADEELNSSNIKADQSPPNLEGTPPDPEVEGNPPNLGWVQSKARILSESGLTNETNTKMFQLLDRLEAFTKT